MIISQTPLRISFVGGGSDIKEYYSTSDGHVVSSTIDKYIYVIVKERYDNDIYVSWSKKKEIVTDVECIEHDLVRESLIKVGIDCGIEITMLADIPSTGTGLGSSSSLTVGLLNVFYAYKGMQVTSKRLAEESSEIEIDILRKPIGKQDQYNAAYGGLSHYVFKANGKVEVCPIELNNNERLVLGSNLILHYTGVARDADDILDDQTKNIKNNLNSINKMTEHANVLTHALNKKQYDEIGSHINKNWLLKKGLSKKITTNLIDSMIKTSMTNGAFGCKILGAGGGGFLLSYVQREKQNQFRDSMNEYRELPFMLEPFGSRIIFNVKS